MADRLALLRASDLAGDATAEAIELLPSLFGAVAAEGVLMAVRAAGAEEDAETASGALIVLIDDLIRASP